MNEQQVPQTTHYKLIGGSIYLKIPADRHRHLGLEKMKTEEGPNELPAKFLAQINQKGEHYQSSWNPHHPSQQTEDEEQ